jgi:hypothetical protein
MERFREHPAGHNGRLRGDPVETIDVWVWDLCGLPIQHLSASSHRNGCPLQCAEGLLPSASVAAPCRGVVSMIASRGDGKAGGHGEEEESDPLGGREGRASSAAGQDRVQLRVARQPKTVDAQKPIRSSLGAVPARVRSGRLMGPGQPQVWVGTFLEGLSASAPGRPESFHASVVEA